MGGLIAETDAEPEVSLQLPGKFREPRRILGQLRVFAQLFAKADFRVDQVEPVFAVERLAARFHEQIFHGNPIAPRPALTLLVPQFFQEFLAMRWRIHGVADGFT